MGLFSVFVISLSRFFGFHKAKTSCWLCIYSASDDMKIKCWLLAFYRKSLSAMN